MLRSLRKRDLFIYLVHNLRNWRFGKEDLVSYAGKTLMVSRKRVSNLISEAKGMGYLFDNDGLTLTEKGRERMSKVDEIFDRIWLEPDLYNLTSPLSLSKVLSVIGDPLLKVQTACRVHAGESFDVPFVVQGISGLVGNRSVYEFLEELHGTKTEDRFDQVFERSLPLFMGIEESGLSDRSTEDLIFLAEAERRAGRIEMSRIIYRNILDRPSLNKNNWVVASCGHYRIMQITEKERALELISEMNRSDMNTLQAAYRDMVMSNMLSETGDNQDGKRLLKRSIGRFRYEGSFTLLAMAELYLGIVYFREKDLDMAELYLRKSLEDLKSSKRKRGTLMGYVLVNYADVFILHGDFDKAKRYLNRSKKIFRNANDMEGLAGYEFNKSLLHAQLKEEEKANYHFRLSEQVADPLPWRYQREERRRVFKDRMVQSGLKVDKNLFIHPPSTPGRSG
jgi:tetratricopeptide (TPR) repeat protein